MPCLNKNVHLNRYIEQFIIGAKEGHNHLGEVGGDTGIDGKTTAQLGYFATVVLNVGLLTAGNNVLNHQVAAYVDFAPAGL